MIMEKRVAEILRSLHTTDARELAKAFAFEPKRSYDLACAAVARTGDLVKAAELVESGWSHEDVVIPVRLSLEDLVRQSRPDRDRTERRTRPRAVPRRRLPRRCDADAGELMSDKRPERVVRDGMVAVLVSRGYGAGWSTWSNDKSCMYWPDVVAWVDGGKTSRAAAHIGTRGALLRVATATLTYNDNIDKKRTMKTKTKTITKTITKHTTPRDRKLIDLRLGDWRNVLGDVAAGSVRLILTSPPYDNARTYEGTADAVDFDALADFALRVLAPGGTLAMVLDGAVNDMVLSVTPYRVIVDWSTRPGWYLSQVLAYGRHGQPGQYLHRFRRDHEPLIVYRKNGRPIVCNKDELATPAKYGVDTTAHHYQWGTKRDGTKRRNNVRPVRPIRHRGSIWDYGASGHGRDPSSSTGHPATFSERFARDAVVCWSNPGDLVVDPFGGSGTVARACADLARRCISSERVPAYHDIATRRLSQHRIASHPSDTFGGRRNRGEMNEICGYGPSVDRLAGQVAAPTSQGQDVDAPTGQTEE